MNTRTQRTAHRYDGDLRADLLAEAVRVIAQDGTASVSLRALTRSLGVSHAAPKNHFPTKEALFAEIARDGFIEFAERLNVAGDRAKQAGGDPLAVLEAQGLAYLDFAKDRPSHFAIMFRRDLFDPDILAQESQVAFNVLVASVTEAQEAGWHRDVDTFQVSMMVWSTTHGLANLETQNLSSELTTATRSEILQLALGTHARSTPSVGDLGP